MDEVLDECLTDRGCEKSKKASPAGWLLQVGGVSGAFLQAKKKALLSKTFLNFGAPRGQRPYRGSNVPQAAITCDARLCRGLAVIG
jgi:hypothetical protein